MSPPSSGSKEYANQGTSVKQVTSKALVVSCLAYSSTLKIVATCSSKTSVDFQLTTRGYIPENRTLHELVSITGPQKNSKRKIYSVNDYVQ
jgi:hypothetical protein